MYIGGLNAHRILYQPTLGWLLFIELSKIYTNILCKMIIYTLTLLATCVMIELVSKSFFLLKALRIQPRFKEASSKKWFHTKPPRW